MWGGGGSHLLQGCLERRNIRQQTGPVQFHPCELGQEAALSRAWSLITSSQLKHLSSGADRRLQPRFGLQVFGQLLERRTRTMRSKRPPSWSIGSISPQPGPSVSDSGPRPRPPAQTADATCQSPAWPRPSTPPGRQSPEGTCTGGSNLQVNGSQGTTRGSHLSPAHLRLSFRLFSSLERSRSDSPNKVFQRATKLAVDTPTSLQPAFCSHSPASSI